MGLSKRRFERSAGPITPKTLWTLDAWKRSRAWLWLTDHGSEGQPLSIDRQCVILVVVCDAFGANLGRGSFDVHECDRGRLDLLSRDGPAGGVDALEDRRPRPSRVWNRIPDQVRDQIIELALNVPELSPRELAVTFTDTKGYFVSESSVYRLLKVYDLITSPAFIVIKAADEFHDKTTAPNQLWQTDFTYLKVIGWGWFYLSTVLDDFSRYIIAWKLCTTMKAGDVTDTLTMALTASGCDSARVLHKPKLLSDNGPSYIAAELAEWIDANGMSHVRGAPLHPQTQGKIERWHQTLKNRILLENYFLPGDLERQVAAFVDHYNHRRYHESIGNLTPADVYFGRGDIIMLERERIKRETITQRRLLHRKAAA